MQCPYPDCDGTVSAGEPYCGECGRSLTAGAVAAARAGQAARSSPPVPATDLLRTAVRSPEPISWARPLPAPNPLGWVLVAIAGLALLLLLCVVSAILLWRGAIIGEPPPSPVLPTPPALLSFGRALWPAVPRQPVDPAVELMQARVRQNIEPVILSVAQNLLDRPRSRLGPPILGKDRSRILTIGDGRADSSLRSE